MVNLSAVGLGSTVPVVAVVTLVIEYRGGRIIILPTPFTQPVICRWRGPSRQDALTPAEGQLQAKGMVSHWVSHANRQICQPN